MVSGVQRRLRAKPQLLDAKPTVSVVVPVYNYGAYIESCVRSVLSQPDVDVDVLILDDCSTDDSLAVARRLAEEEARVRVITHQTNRGHIPTVNEGMAEVAGEYIVKLDADDMLTPGSLARGAALLKAYPSAGFVYGLPWIIGDGVAPTVAASARSWTVWPGREWLQKQTKKAHNPIMQPEALMRSSALREAGPYREQLPHTSDFEMWLRLAARYDVGRVNGAYQGFKRVHGANMSTTVNGGLLTDITGRLRAIDSLFAEYARVLPEAARMSEQSHQTLAREALEHAIHAYARGVAAQEPVDDYLALADRVWGGTERLRAWRLASRLHAAKGVPQHLYPSVLARETLRDLRYRARWYQWKWSGM
jgi:GT2 family glycosyltransferase